jgi:acetyltransferase-like isoleucine patch superfamily enzyme
MRKSQARRKREENMNLIRILKVISRTIHWVRTYVTKAYVRYTAVEVGTDLYIGGRVKLSGTVYLGDNVNLNGMTINGCGTVRIGNNFHSGTECLIISSNHNYEGTALPYDSTHVVKEVRIGNQVWIGDRVTILGGVTIGDGAIIQAGAVVVKNVPPLSIAGGNPAHVFRMRDEKHYRDLLECQRFH